MRRRCGPSFSMGKQQRNGSSDNVTTNMIQKQPIDEVLVDPTLATDQEALADLIRPFFLKQSAVVLRGGAAPFDAINKWSNKQRHNNTWDYLQQQLSSSSYMGAVELGGSYSHESSQRAEIPIHDYITYLQMFEERHGRTGAEDPWHLPTEIQNSELVYMAQNELPMPLHDDIQIPSFCDDPSFQVGLGRLYSVMWWLGPRASTSPLHFDPLDNLLMQIMGRKVIWLFPPSHHKDGVSNNHNSHTTWHYAGDGGRQQSNTSPINPEQYDVSQYPVLAEQGPVVARTCVLHPGDVLYIPSKWWHYVRSVDTSASVNVWWR